MTNSRLVLTFSQFRERVGPTQKSQDMGGVRVVSGGYITSVVLSSFTGFV